MNKPAARPRRQAASLRQQLLLWLLPGLTALLVVDSVFSYRAALRAADAAYDRLLQGSMRAIAERVTVRDGEIAVDLPYAALEMFEAGSQDRVFYRVSKADGSLLTGYSQLAFPQQLPPLQRPVFYDTTVQGEAVRAGALWKPLYDPPEAMALVQVAETVDARTAFARRLVADVFLRELAILVLTTSLLWLGVHRGVAPLRALREAIRARRPDDLSPLADETLPREVRPLIEALNNQAVRLAEYVAAHERLVADASHQLRTPLALLRTQAELLARTDDPGERAELTAALVRTTEQTTRLADQLLTLARSEDAAQRERTAVDLGALAAATLSDLVPLARTQQIDLAYVPPAAPCVVLATPPLLRELIGNLIDNAVRYGPPASEVELALQQAGDQALLTVSDAGPGIPEAERERVFERFYRLPGAPSHGSGLGLAIVREIAQSHGGRVMLSEVPGGGLRVTVALPLQKRRRDR